MELQELRLAKSIVLIIIFVLIYLFESIFPFYKNRKKSLIHSLSNLSLAIFNSIITSIFFSAAFLYVSEQDLTQRFGLLHNLNYSFITELIIGIVLFDLWMYIWHVLNHKSRFLWRFHKTHHTETEMETTTALRFHPIEIIISNILKLGIIAIIGFNLEQLLIYEAILLPVIILHHSNMIFPEYVDRYYRILFASPHMHRIHHSDVQKETDSNYTSIFSIWDRSFRTFQLRKDPENIKQGLKNYKDKKWNTFWWILKTPFI